MLFVFSPSYGYSDINSGHWGYEAINVLSEKELLSGYPDGTFKPDNNMTRAEFITILMKIIVPNADVSNNTGYWADGSINLAKSKNIIFENEYSEFNPDKAITRREICLMIYRSLEELKDINTEKLSNKKEFLDVNRENKEEERISAILSHVGILKGYPDGSARLDNFSSRAETCCFIDNFLKCRCILLSVINDQDKVIYENGIAKVNILKLPSALKKWENADDIPYATTTIKNISLFPFNEPIAQYEDTFEKINNSDDRYLQYRKKLGENNFVIAVEFETTNNTSNSDLYAGVEFLHIYFPKEDISVIDVFDTDEINRQLQKNADVGQLVKSGESWNTSAFYIVNLLPKEEIRFDRTITDLYDAKNIENKLVTSFHSLIINLGGS